MPETGPDRVAVVLVDLVVLVGQQAEAGRVPQQLAVDAVRDPRILRGELPQPTRVGERSVQRRAKTWPVPMALAAFGLGLSTGPATVAATGNVSRAAAGLSGGPFEVATSTARSTLTPMPDSQMKPACADGHPDAQQ